MKPIGLAATTGSQPADALVSPRKLMRWGGAAGMLAGVLTVVANLLHPPRSFHSLAGDAQHTSWEVVHVLGILAFIVSAFALIAFYAVQVERAGLAGLIGFAGTLGGSLLSLGVLVPDALIFPVLARDPDTIRLLVVPGPIIGQSGFTIYMALSGVTYCLGTLLFFGVSARAGALPRWGSLLVAVGILPLVFGALIWQGLDVLGAVGVGLGYLRLGYALWRPEAGRQPGPAR